MTAREHKLHLHLSRILDMYGRKGYYYRESSKRVKLAIKREVEAQGRKMQKAP